jgi:SAM-dependent methyltransferase
MANADSSLTAGGAWSETTEIVEANLSAYSRGAAIYAGDVPEEDDPPWREACRGLFLRELRGALVQGRDSSNDGDGKTLGGSEDAREIPHILEVGCGPALDSAAFQRAGCEVLATDICEEFITLVRQRFPALPAQRMNLIEPNLPRESFHGIYGFMCFLHVPHAAAPRALQGLRALLRPGGVLFLGLIASPVCRDYVVPSWIGMPNNPAHFFCYGEEEMQALAREAGFSEASIHHLPPSEDGPYGRGAAKERADERRITSYQLIARA